MQSYEVIRIFFHNQRTIKAGSWARMRPEKYSSIQFPNAGTRRKTLWPLLLLSQMDWHRISSEAEEAGTQTGDTCDHRQYLNPPYHMPVPRSTSDAK